MNHNLLQLVFLVKSKVVKHLLDKDKVKIIITILIIIVIVIIAIIITTIIIAIGKLIFNNK